MSETQRISALVIGTLALLGACLPEDPAVKGRLLYAGTGIEHPEFMGIGGEPWVMFELRQRRPVPHGLGGTLEIHLVNWQDASQHRVLLPSRAERPEWPRVVDGEGALFYMTNERKPEQGLRLPVGTLMRVKLDSGVIETIDDVFNYSVHAQNPKLFYYRKHRPDAAQAELHLRTRRRAGSEPGPADRAGAVPRSGADVLHRRRGPGDDPGGRPGRGAEAAAQQGGALPAAPERAATPSSTSARRARPGRSSST